MMREKATAVMTLQTEMEQTRIATLEAAQKQMATEADLKQQLERELSTLRAHERQIATLERELKETRQSSERTAMHQSQAQERLTQW